MTSREKPTFDKLGIALNLLNILKKNNYHHPTPIQIQSIPIANKGRDIVGIAQTGTGKTLAFGIPLIQRLARFKGMGLVILPTRELAQQVDESLRTIGTQLGLRTAVLIGGEQINRQKRQLKKRPHVIIATPGRLIDHLKQKFVSLNKVNILVLDEADRMLDMGFAPQLNQILREVPTQRQTMLFSATMPPEILKMATKQMELPLQIEVAPSGASAETIEQEIYIVDRDFKFNLFLKILHKYKGAVLVFSRTKYGAKKICRKLRISGFGVAEIHSNRSQNQRREALQGFKTRKYRVLVATDIAARGIDVQNIELVINYDLPDAAGDYVHRIGRTGRAGKRGRAISFVLPNQKKEVAAIERLIRKRILISNKGEMKFDTDSFSPSRSQNRHHRYRKYRRNHRHRK